MISRFSEISLLSLIIGLGLLCSSTVGAQTLTSYSHTQVFDRTPDQISSDWSKMGEGAALVLTGPELLLNDNSQGALIAYQGLLGQIEAEHSVVVRAELKVYSNFGGRGAVLEVSRPGVEVILRLFPDQIVLMERAGRNGPRWLGSASVDLSSFAEVEISKASINEDEDETIRVSVNGVKVIEAAPFGGGELGVGRVAFGSLGYADIGASVWRWMDLEVNYVDSGGHLIPTNSASFGQLKSQY